MASVSVLLFVVLSTLLAGTRGFLIGYDELAGFVNVSNTVHAMTISDYYTQINDGAIVAYTLNLTGSLSAATVDFGFLHAEDTTTGDLTALNTHTPSATFATLQNSGNSTFHSPVTVEGELNVRGTSEIAGLEALSLTATNETTINGILFAQSNLQVSENLSVRGNTRIFGDLLANSSVDVGMNLDVHDEAHVGLDLMISNNLHTLNLTVDGTAILGQIKVAGWVNNTESADVGGDLNANSGAFKGSLSAHDATVMENFNGKGTLSVNGYLKSVKTASFAGDLAVQGDQVVQSWLSADSTADFQQGLSISDDLTVDVDISSDGTLSAVDAMFTTLSVDTATLETLTAEFVTSTNLQATDALIGKSFMSGATTLDTLVVKSTSTLTSAVADSISGTSVNAGSATSTDLEVTDSGLFVNVEVKTMISAGSPSSMTHFANFDSANTDLLKFLELDGDEADITTLEGNEFNYESINASMFTSETLMSDSGDFDYAMITSAVIDRLKSDEANITTYEVSDETRVVTFYADGKSVITDVTAQDTESYEVTADQAVIDALTSFEITSERLTATTATVSSLMSDKGWITKLTATNSTITNAWATTATVGAMNGVNINYTTVAVTNITTPRGISNTFDSSRSIAASWLWSQHTNFSTLDSKTLRVTGDTWLHNLTLHNDLMVDGESTLQMGFISGPAVVAHLDVVEDTLLDSLSATGTSFLTDLMVKRVTITDDFQANEAQLGTVSSTTLTTTGATTVLGGLTVNGDSLLRGNLVVAGTTQFQTGSFSRIGTALITTTDMEAFNLNAADGIFGEIETSDFEARRAVMFERSISLSALRDDPSGAEFSLFMQIAPTRFDGVTTTQTFDVNTMAYLHTGNASVDALVVTSSTNASLAALRVKGDGSIDLIDGDILFDELNVGGGVEFENENNIAYPMNHPSVVLSQGQESTFFAYSDLEDRDLVAPGDFYDPTRFQAPTGTSDLLTLTPGHYRVSGQVYLAPSAAATSSIVAIVQASVSAWMGTASNSSNPAFWTTSCIANFNLVSSSTWGGSCSFSDVLVVRAGEIATLRTSVSWPFSSSPSADTLTVSPKSNVQIAEYFERTSEGL